MSAHPLPSTCQESGSWTCAAICDWTGDTRLAHVSAWLIGKPLTVVCLIIGAVVVRWLVFRVIDRVVRRAETGVMPSRLTALGDHTAHAGEEVKVDAASGRRVQRAKSLGSMLKSLTTGIVFGIVFVMILSQVGVDIAPILASAGVLGLAIGFGAQSLVKDFLSGIAMMIEDQYGIGDSVDLGDVSGTVEAIGLRVTRLRDVNGTVWYVRNGEILKVGNQSQNWARTVLDVAVGYDEDVDRVQDLLHEIAHQLFTDPAFAGVVLEEPEVWGVQSLSPDGVVVRVTLKTAPSEQWRVAREMRRRIKTRFDAEGIELPLPQRLVMRDRRPEDPKKPDAT